MTAAATGRETADAAAEGTLESGSSRWKTGGWKHGGGKEGKHRGQGLGEGASTSLGT